MKRNTIIKDLREKHSQFATLVAETSASLSKEEVLNHTFIDGGCIASLLLGEEPKDYDIYGTGTGMDDRISAAFSYVKGAEDTKNSITLREDVVLQFITCKSGSPENVVADFDFHHCQSYFYGGKLVLPSKALESLILKELSWTKRTPNKGTTLRVIRFLNRGWTIDPKEYLEILKSCGIPENAAGEITGVY